MQFDVPVCFLCVRGPFAGHAEFLSRHSFSVPENGPPGEGGSGYEWEKKIGGTARKKQRRLGRMKGDNGGVRFSNRRSGRCHVSLIMGPLVKTIPGG